jgi:hypothetical protein
LLLNPHNDFDLFDDRSALEVTLMEMESGDYRQAQAVIRFLYFE